MGGVMTNKWKAFVGILAVLCLVTIIPFWFGTSELPASSRNIRGIQIDSRNAAGALRVDQLAAGDILTLKDAGTEVASMPDGGDLELNGKVRIGYSGTPGATQAANSLYVKGGFEVDGALKADGALTFGGALDMSNQLITNIGNSGTDFTTGGGLTLANGLLVSSDGITVTKGGLIVTAGGATITAGGLDMTNDAITNIGAAGTDFGTDGGLTLAGGLVVSTDGITVTSGPIDMTTGVISNIGNAGTDFDAEGGLTLATDLVVTTDGITVTSGGIDVTAGGVYIAAGGLDINGTVFDLDADADTSITADTDDQIDIEISGADDFRFTANTFSVLAGSSVNWVDDTYLTLGSSADVTLEYDTAITPDGLILSGTTTDIPFYVGLPTTSSFDLEWAGSAVNNWWGWDASADKLYLNGPVHPTGFNSLPSRYELRWVAGQEGLPDLNNTAWSDVIDARFELLGTNGSADDVTYYAEGGLVFETDGADGDEVILLPHLDANQSPWTQTTWGTDQETHWECWISTTANISDTIIWAGLKLTNTEVTATDDDQVFFRYENGVNGGEWQAISSIADSDDAHDTNVAVAVSTAYHLKIVIASNRTAKMYINGVLVETTAALTTAKDLIPYIGVAADGAAAAKSIRVRGQAISRNYG